MIDIERETRILSQEIPRAAGSYRRFAGTEADHRTIEHIAGRLRELGLDTRIEWLQFMGWEPMSESLTVLAPEARTIECAPLTWAGSTPEGGVEGRLVYAGPTDLVLFRWDRWAILTEDGEEGAYVIGITDDFPALPEPLDFPDINLPCVEFGKADNDLLHRWRQTGEEIRVNLNLRTVYKPQSRTANVIGRVPGARDPNTVIKVTCHHDSFSPGASDNASGVVSLMLLAERYRARGYAYTIEFTSFGAEEWNLLGSRTHMEMQKQRGELGRVKAVLNIDTVSHPEAEWIWMMVDEDDRAHLRRLTQESLRELKPDQRYEVRWDPAARGRYPGAGVDSAVYTHEGIPALTVVWWPFPAMHQRSETRSNPEQIRVTVGIIDKLLQKLAADH